jgi:hypothetical protein
MAFASLEPFGGEVDDLRAGLAPAAFINMNRAPDKDGNMPDPVSAFAFYSWHQKEPEREPEPDTPEEISRNVRNFLNAKAQPDGD